ncbi:tyrosine-type recombinase/integrase [Teredinibacter turnerae]|uniref:phage integrase n=1 Tax=Teredinibacter turnerae TaxID=2426 RepID=UPI00035F9098|nr:tyrosine-type recombinase/integrase [Teredinibacter turnerae]
MTVKKEDDKWLVDVYPHGRSGRRVRKRFPTRIEAQRFEKYILSKAHSDIDWNANKVDPRKLSDLIDIWYKLLGFQLKDGARIKAKLLLLADALGNPVAQKIVAKDFLDYRFVRLDAGINGKTLNNELGYLNSLYNGLKSAGEIKYVNPLAEVKMIKLDEYELSWLTTDQIQTLLATMDRYSKNPHVKLVTKICLATGARWGEAEGLTVDRVNNNQVYYTNTKGRRNRAIPVSEELFREIRLHLTENECFTSSIGAFRRALNESSIVLPKGQAAHVLRHTFASHFMMNGGNILTLQKILGHSTINMTMRYAHLSPDYLLDTIKYNPLTVS